MISTPWDHHGLSAADAKTRGAYYTDSAVAEFLAWWGIRSATTSVLDPSFGGGVFLRAAATRLRKLGGNSHAQIFGAELDRDVHNQIVPRLATEFGLNRNLLQLTDFFLLEATASCAVDAVIGNPPFIRYQRFAGESRDRALQRSQEQRVQLPRLASSWAPFVVHSVGMLRPQGRLAMVVPKEIAYAKYALPVLEFLRQSFQQVTFLTFREKLFPNLNEDTLLLLAESKGSGPAKFSMKDYATAASLREVMQPGCHSLTGTRNIDAAEIASGNSRLIEHLIPVKARSLYRELRNSALVQALGSLADVGIGYVTGANEFFHLAPSEVMQWKIPFNFLKPIVQRARAFTGIRFSKDDWLEATNHHEAGYLLHIDKSAKLPVALQAYLNHGQRAGIADAYKCRSRAPWFCVPHVYQPDAFLTYMSGLSPRLVANDAEAYASNTLHIVRMKGQSQLTGDALATLWQSSLTHLSVELEGHALGGGMLKLEPTEAGNVLLPCPPQVTSEHLQFMANEVDALHRAGRENEAYGLVDAEILRKELGLSRADCRLLTTAARILKNRRGCGGFTYDAA